jgi:hypothetical protein
LFGLGARIRRRSGGTYAVSISDEERELVANLVPQLQELLVATGGDPGDEPSIRRLFPTAYPDDPQRDAEYQQLMRDDLLRNRLDQLDVFSRSIQAEQLTEDELQAWIASINGLRLVLGTRLDVAEDDDLDSIPAGEPERTHVAVYHYLGHLLGELVDAAMR